MDSLNLVYSENQIFRDCNYLTFFKTFFWTYNSIKISFSLLLRVDFPRILWEKIVSFDKQVSFLCKEERRIGRFTTQLTGNNI
jgi:hypothetical protein